LEGGRTNFAKEKFHLNPAAHTANAVSKRSTDYAFCINDWDATWLSCYPYEYICCSAS